jgi:hypothetical protein
MIMNFWNSQQTLERSLQHLGKSYVKSTVKWVKVLVRKYSSGNQVVKPEFEDLWIEVLYLLIKP